MRARAGGIVAWFLVAALAAAGQVRAAEIYRVATFLDPSEALTDTRPFQLVLQIEGERAPQRVRPPEFPAIDGLVLIGGPNTTSRLYFSGGRANASYQISYQLLAERPGRFALPALVLDVDGETYRTEPLTIDVGRGQDPSRAVMPGAPGGAARAADPVFLEVQLGQDDVYVGQPVPLTVTLFSAVRVSGAGWRSQPTFTNFWVEKIEIAQDEMFQKRIGDVVYRGYPLERRMLVPLSAGEFTIEPYVAQVQVRQSSGDVFDVFSFGRTETVVRKTPELKITVAPLPAGQPAGFSGAVGRFRLDVGVDRERAAVNDAVALRATVEGEGFLQSVASPEFEPPPGVKVLDRKVAESSQRVSGKLTARKTWEWILVPLDAGALELPAVRFSYFDPAGRKYEVLASEPIELAVDRGERAADPGALRGEIQLQRRDLAYIKPLRGQLTQRHPRAHERAVFHALLLAPVLLVPLTLLAARRRARLSRDQGLSRARRARARARKGLQAARRGLEAADSASFHEQVARALVEYVADRFNRSAAGMTYELADDLLASHDVDPGLRRAYRACLERCDFARFVPAAARTERRTEVLEEAASLVERLERSW